MNNGPDGSEGARAPWPGVRLKPEDSQKRAAVWRAARFVLLLALLVRLAWCTLATVTPISDCAGYDSLARELLEHGRYQHSMGAAWRTPGYPLFLAGVYAVLGEDLRAVALVQAFVGALSAAATVVLAGQIASTRTALLAGVLLAVWPTAVVYTPVLVTENLAALLLLALLVCVAWTWHATRGRALALVIGAGVLFGLLLLTRPANCFFAPPLLILLCYDMARWKWRWTAPLIFGVCALVTVAPWLIRNYRLGLGPFTLTTQSGLSTWWGNNSQTDDGAGPPPRDLDAEARLDERARDKFYREKVETWLREQPRRYLELCGVRAVRFMGTESDWFAAKFAWPTPDNDLAMAQRNESMSPGKSVPRERIELALAVEGRHKRYEQALRLVVAPLLLLALGWSLFRARKFAFINLPVLFYIIGFSLTVFVERYRAVTDPLLLILLAALLSDIICGTRDLGGGRKLRLVKGVLAVLVVAASIYAHVAGLDQTWYRLAPFKPPQTAWKNGAPPGAAGQPAWTDGGPASTLRPFPMDNPA